MRITIELLEEKRVDAELIEWFIDNFPSTLEADSDDILELLKKQKLCFLQPFLIKIFKLNYAYESFYTNGKRRCVKNYVNGNLDGECISYYQTGNPESKENYIDGKLNGLCEWYRKNGEIECRSNYVEGMLDGLFEWFYPSGNVKFREYYREDKKYKKSEMFNIDGVTRA